MLLAALTLAAALQPITAQIVRLGSCQNYIGDGNFDVNFIETLTTHAQGFHIAATSGPTNRRCQRILFTHGGLYKYSYYDSAQELRNFSGSYTADPSTFTSLGSITLSGLPVGELGAGLTRRVQLKVIMAEPRRILVASCIPFGVANTAQVHALVPANAYTSSSGLELINHLKVRQFPNQESLVQTSQLCHDEPPAAAVEDNLVRRVDFVVHRQPTTYVGSGSSRPTPFAVDGPHGTPQARSAGATAGGHAADLPADAAGEAGDVGVDVAVDGENVVKDVPEDGEDVVVDVAVDGEDVAVHVAGDTEDVGVDVAGDTGDVRVENLEVTSVIAIIQHDNLPIPVDAADVTKDIAVVPEDAENVPEDAAFELRNVAAIAERRQLTLGSPQTPQLYQQVYYHR